ncbi:MAG TPA: hypothetical protein VNM14_22635 [Planctomycetota bacterium]|nr:hypothetical protein [Planctomycetota bacterium]
MSRFFAAPVLVTVLTLVGIRMAGTPSPRTSEPLDIVVSLPQEPAAETAPVPAPAPTAVAPEPPPPAPAPAPPPAPLVIVLEPLPQPVPEVRTEVVERTVYVPQQTVIYAPTTNVFYPPAEVAPQPPPQEVIDTPLIVLTNPPHGHPMPPPRRAKAQQDTFFKEIPFLPPTPKGPRWNP